MKSRIICLLVALMAFAMVGNATYKYESVAGDITGTRIYHLSNGLTVYLSQNKAKPRITAHIAVRTGSRNDPAETTGLAHYLEHLMFKGTKLVGTNNYEAEKPLLDTIEARFEVYRHITDPAKRKAYYHKIDSISQLAAKYFIPNEYDKLMATIGSDGSNAFTSNDVTCYTENVPSNQLENWAKIQGDRFQNMVMRGFHTELEAVYEEKNISMASDGHKMYAAMLAMLYPGHPYGTQTTIGTQEHLKNPSITNIKAYFDRYYCPNNVAICMAGDLDFDATMAIIEKYFGNWKPNPSLSRPEFAPVPPITAPRDTTIWGQEAEYFDMAWRFPEAKAAENDTLALVSQLLTNGTAGLFDLDLMQKMKVQGAWAEPDALNDYSALFLIGYPLQDQSLEDVRSLMLSEVEKLRKGEFSDELISSVINNMKRHEFEAADDNRSRVSDMVDAFICNKKWEDVALAVQYLEGVTKQQIMAFVNRYMRDDNYVTCWKRQGEDKTLKKIEKPHITPLPTNREMQSQFVTDIMNAEVTPIQPVFVDFNKDMTVTKTKSGLPVLYKQNTENGLFTLNYRWTFGNEADKRMDNALGYMDFLGTDKMTNEQFKQKMYALACDYSFSAYSDEIDIQIHGLSENMEKACALLEDLLKNAKVDKDAYDKCINLVLDNRADAKTNQKENYSRLQAYGEYGPYNSYRNIMSEKEMRETNPLTLVNLVKNLANMQHMVMYYGPMTQAQLLASVAKTHRTGKKLAAVPVNKEYKLEQTPKTEIYLAPYEAKNIYFVEYNNSGSKYDVKRAPIVRLFNEYFGAGGMNCVVFQDLREARGLAYSAYAKYVTPDRQGKDEYAFNYVITQTDKMMDCVRAFNGIVDTIPQTQGAFEIAKNSVMNQLAANRTMKMSVLWKYINAQKLGINYDLNKTLYETIPTLTLQDVANFEKENMARKPYRYLILGNEKDLDIPALEKIAPIKHLTTEEIFGY